VAEPGRQTAGRARSSYPTYTLTLTSHDDNVAADQTFTLFDDVGVS
jgi:hypothetical protein